MLIPASSRPVSPAGSNSASDVQSVPLLVWSSRESIRAQLLSVLPTIPLEAFGPRREVVRLLGLFGSPELLPLFKALLLDEREHSAVRVRALLEGLSHGLHLSDGELAGLLTRPLAPEYRSLFLQELLPLARTEDALSTLEATLLQLPARDRVHLLLHWSSELELLHPRLVDWLWARWSQHDRQSVPPTYDHGDGNRYLVLSTWEHPESWAYLTLKVPALPVMELEWYLSCGLPREALARLLAPHPEQSRLAAESLLLPLPALLAYFGHDALLRRLRRVVRAESIAQRAPYQLLQHPVGFDAAVELLGEWPEARPLLFRLLCDFDLAEEVRRELLATLFERDRAVAIRWALVALSWPDNLPLVRFLLHRAVEKPEPIERPLFLAALRSTDDVAHCFAIEGLLTLGESGASWCDRLTSLLHAPHPVVRLRAAAGLARQGHEEGLPLLRRTALEAPEPWLRAEALRWLGEVDLEASRPVLEQGLSDPGVSDRHIELGGAEALHALSRRGRPEDLTALLNAYVRGPFVQDLDDHLEYHLRRQEGRSTEEPFLPLARNHALEFLSSLMN